MQAPHQTNHTVISRTYLKVHSSTSNGNPFRVVQFNTLADKLSDAFPYTEKKFLTWEYRKSKLVHEIAQLGADIIGLEEVDHYEDHFEPEMSKLGYGSLYQKKMDRDSFDGCALMYNKSKFSLLGSISVRFDEKESQVAIVAKLQCLHNDKKLCVSVGHLKAKEGFEDRRLKQGHAWLQRIHGFLNDSSIPIVVIGDFNDTQENPVYKLFANQKAVNSQGLELSQPFSLKSAYTLYDESGREPYSTYKKRETEVIRTIDYIWYTTDSLTVNQLLEIPAIETLKDRLPCADYPSDHLAIGAEIDWL